MRYKLRNKCGSYIPSFLLLNLDFDEGVEDLNKLSEEGKAIIAHEYIHFLQDITTTYGVMNCIHIGDILKTYYHAIKKEDSSTISIPYTIPSNDIAALNTDLNSLYLGSYGEMDLLEISKIDSAPNGQIPGYEQVPVVSLFNTLTNRSIEFGVHAIRESQAYMIESELFDGPGAPDYPYRAVERLVQYVYPELARSRALLIALCDVALMADYNSGNFMYRLVSQLKADRLIPVDYHKIYEFAFDGWMDAQTGLDIHQYFMCRSAIADKQFQDLFGGDFNIKLREWLHQVIFSGRQLRLSDTHLMASLVDGKRDEARKRFGSLTQRIGMPLIRWQGERYSTTDNASEANAQLLPAYLNVFALLSTRVLKYDDVLFP